MIARQFRLWIGIGAAWLAALPVCAEPPVTEGAATSSSTEEPVRIAKQAYPYLHNLLQVSPTIYTGAEPDADAAYADLAKLGVKTVVSVDGARPDVEAAARHGLRYVHIPFGYDGVPQKASDSLARLVREAEGPFYIHCHHGNHRGPAGAAIACIAAGERDGKSALAILKMAGTSLDYPGLWRDVENYAPPPQDAKLPELTPVAEVGSLAAAMAQIDRSNDLLKLGAAAEWKPPEDHPDVSLSQEALLVKEGLVEARRTLAGDFDERFRQWMQEAASAAGSVEAALRASDFAAANEHFQKLGQSCKKCHGEYRN